MSKVIVITSGKGGVGKTTSTANIGAGLARMNKKAVLVDTDIGLRNLDVVMGLENRIIYNLVDVIEGNCRIRQALIRDKHYPGLYLLPSAQTRDKSALRQYFFGNSPLFCHLILQCRRAGDIISSCSAARAHSADLHNHNTKRGKLCRYYSHSQSPCLRGCLCQD